MKYDIKQKHFKNYSVSSLNKPMCSPPLPPICITVTPLRWYNMLHGSKSSNCIKYEVTLLLNEWNE